MKRSMLLTVGLLLLAFLPYSAAADDDTIQARVSLIIGFPAEGDENPEGVLVVPGTVIPIDVESKHRSTNIDREELQSLQLSKMGAKLARSLRLARFEVAYTQLMSFAIDVPRDLPGPVSDSDVSLRATLLGFDANTASFQAQFFERSAVIADTPVAITRGKRAVIGGVDGEAAPYLFLIIEPESVPSTQKGQPLFVGGDVTPPRALIKTPPQYTELARKERLQGVVIVQAIIDAAGNVAETKVLKGLPMGLNEAAVDAIGQWQFEPAMLDGKPVPVYYNLTINFRLEEKPKEP